MPHPLVEQGLEHRLVITASGHLARVLRHEYALQQLAMGRTSWQTPMVYSRTAWLSKVWSEQVADESTFMQLSQAQELSIWEQCISSDTRETGDSLPLLMQVASVARHARIAEAQLTQWQAQQKFEQMPDYTLSDDARLFRRWREQFHRRCRRNRWIDEVSAQMQCLKRIAGGAVEIPKHVVLVGFSVADASLRALTDAVEKAGATVTSWIPTAKGGACHVAIGTSDDELKLAVSWAHSISQTAPDARVGLVVPNLDQHRHRIQQLLGDVFAPEVFFVTRHRSLGECPIVRDALAALKLGRGRQATAVWEQHLRSVFFAGAQEEQQLRDGIAAQLRDMGELEYALGHLLTRTGLTDSTVRSVKAKQLHALSELMKQAPARQLPARWSEFFSVVLKRLGWPGERILSRAERQAYEQIDEALTGFASLNMVLGEISYAQALRRFSQLLRDESVGHARQTYSVEVLSPADSVGMQFSHLWVLGLSESVWPRSASPNPLLPLQLQRDLRMPRCDVSWEVSWAESVLAHWSCAAQTLITSHADMVEDQPCVASPMVTSLESVQVSDVVPTPTVFTAQSMCRSAPELESLHDFRLPLPPDTRVVRGGTSILKNQSACPFKAFATHRLAATSMGVTSAGLDAKERGILTHEILSRVWQRLCDHNTLVQMPVDQLQKLVKQEVEVALTQRIGSRPVTLQSAFGKLERQRHIGIVVEWLLAERQRTAFQVAQLEQAEVAQVGNLQISIRADRIDRLADGGLIVIDYKTGQAKASNWDGERPEEPQLLAYGMHLQDEGKRFDGLAFAVVRHEGGGFFGLGKTQFADGIKTLGVNSESGKSAWQAKSDEWRMVVTRLANDFAAGDARVDPRDTNTCRYCELPGICRIGELQTGLYEDNGS